jgi:hypothetical protein
MGTIGKSGKLSLSLSLSLKSSRIGFESVFSLKKRCKLK